MTPQELKNSILWMAVQGKLSTPYHDEGVAFASDAWDINEEENFTIPENWKWKRFGFFGDLRMGKTILKSDLSDSGIPVYSATQSDDVLGYIEHVELDLHRNDLVIPARGNSIGYVTLVQDEIATCTQTTICVRNIHDICPEYLYWCCYAFKDKWFVFSGSAIPQVTVKQISQFMVPTPPIEEQKRIIVKLEEILPLIDRYEAAWNKLEEFNNRFPGDMQKSILQLAIQGKLVEQRPEEGTGEELFQQIQAEKQALIKAGKIKKEKPLPEITEDEIPFDIPDGWKWIRVGDVFNVGTGMTPLKTESRFFQGGTIPWVTSSLTSQRYIQTAENYVTEYAMENTSLVLYPANTLLIAMYGQGKTRGQVSQLLIDATINQACAALGNIITDKWLIAYVYYFFLFNYEVLRKKAEGTSQPNLNLSKIKETLLPLPPLAEQKRIVAKLEEILPLCDRLK